MSTHRVVCVDGVHNQHTKVAMSFRRHKINEEVMKRISSAGISVSKLTTYLGICRTQMAYMLREGYCPFSELGEILDPARRLCEVLGANVWELWPAAKNWENIPASHILKDNLYYTKKDNANARDEEMWYCIDRIIRRAYKIFYPDKLHTVIGQRRYETLRLIYDNVNGYRTQEAAGKIMGTTRENIRQIHNTAISRIRWFMIHNSSVREMCDFLRLKHFTR